MNALNVIDTAASDRIDPAERPGQQLRRLRHARGLEIERVATQLHLRKGVVDALEQDLYDALPASVYVAGYIRNYARLLELDAAPLLEAYHAAVRGEAPALPAAAPPALPESAELPEPKLEPEPEPAPPEVIPASAPALEPEPEPELPTPPPVSSAAPVLTPAVLPTPPAPPPIILPTFDPPVPEPVAAASSRSVPTLLIIGALLPVLALGWYFRADFAPTLFEHSSEQIPPAQQSDAAMPPAPAPDVSASVSTADESVAVRDEDTPLETPPQLLVPNAVPESAPAVVNAAPAVVAAPVEVALEFVQTAWLSVTGGNGRTVLTGKIREGERRVLTGQPPYQFIIGKANAVKMTVNGVPFDVMAHARGNVARFSFDPTAPDVATDPTEPAVPDSAPSTTPEYD
jgi:cytoskeleton protein RodZ